MVSCDLVVGSGVVELSVVGSVVDSVVDAVVGLAVVTFSVVASAVVAFCVVAQSGQMVKMVGKTQDFRCVRKSVNSLARTFKF